MFISCDDKHSYEDEFKQLMLYYVESGWYFYLFLTIASWWIVCGTGTCSEVWLDNIYIEIRGKVYHIMLIIFLWYCKHIHNGLDMMNLFTWGYWRNLILQNVVTLKSSTKSSDVHNSFKKKRGATCLIGESPHEIQYRFKVYG